jgi:hypothetical protein
MCSKYWCDTDIRSFRLPQSLYITFIYLAACSTFQTISRIWYVKFMLHNDIKQLFLCSLSFLYLLHIISWLHADWKTLLLCWGISNRTILHEFKMSIVKHNTTSRFYRVLTMVDSKSFQQKDGMAMGSMCSPSLATSSWSILRNWLLTGHNTNHCCGSGMLMTHLWFSLMIQSGYRISSVTSKV